MNVYRSSTTMQMDAKYKAVKQSRCMTRVITALRPPINKSVSSRCDPKPGSLTGDAVQFSVGRLPGSYRQKLAGRSKVFSALTCGASEWRHFATRHMIAIEKAPEEVVSNIEMQPRGLKPASMVNALRGAEAPLFHVTAQFPIT